MDLQSIDFEKFVPKLRKHLLLKYEEIDPATYTGMCWNEEIRLAGGGEVTGNEIMDMNKDDKEFIDILKQMRF